MFELIAVIVTMRRAARRPYRAWGRETSLVEAGQIHPSNAFPWSFHPQQRCINPGATPIKLANELTYPRCRRGGCGSTRSPVAGSVRPVLVLGRAIVRIGAARPVGFGERRPQQFGRFVRAHQDRAVTVDRQ